MADETRIERTPVLVVGGGPAGLAAAAELARHGVRCVVIEPRVEVSHRRPRAKTTSIRTMEHLRRWGTADALRAAAPLPVAWSQRVTFCESLAGRRITDFDGAFGLTTARDDRFAEPGQQVPQPVVEEVLRGHLRRRPCVDLRLGHAATDLTHDERMWTARVRRRALTALPPGKLLPDRQPAYVSSWIYVFGVGALAAFGMAIVSGFTIALGGTDWWHTNPVGHFFNSLHLWSVELFMALLVIHLWGKFWMAAWRGRRTLTWITGVVAFVASIIECFTGYLSQQNFDSQWIATNGKDAFNAVGVGAFFNLMNFGQMLLWHVVLIPIVLVAIVGAHVLLVRVRGVSHPLPAKMPRGHLALSALRRADRAPWRGPNRRYDILKEGSIAALVILILTVGLAALLSSPDVPPVTVASWAKVAPADFLGTAASELDGTSHTAGYGPPYNTGGPPQKILFSPANWFGVTQPIPDTAQTFVLAPLAAVAPTDPALASALATYNAASASQQNTWATNYGTAVAKVTFSNGTPVVPAANDGPVPAMLATELTLARSGAIDTDLLAQRGFYGTDFTKPLLFLNDGMYYTNFATAMHLTGTQWGIMNETGSYPGQPWLWLYQLWYQLPGFRTSANADLIAIYLTGLATLVLLGIPFIPGLRDIPRWIPVHRFVWRDWNRQAAGSAGQPESGPKPEPAGQK